MVRHGSSSSRAAQGSHRLGTADSGPGYPGRVLLDDPGAFSLQVGWSGDPGSFDHRSKIASQALISRTCECRLTEQKSLAVGVQ